MKTAKTMVAAIGSFAAAILVSTALYYFTTQPRPEAAGWWMKGSATVCAVCVVLWFVLYVSGKKSAKAATSAASAIGGDNSGTQMTAARDIIHHHHYGPSTPAPVTSPAAASAPSIQSTQQAPVQTATATPHTLQFARKTEQIIFDPMRSQWRLAYSQEARSVSALILWVENQFPTQGKGRSYSLVTSIRAKQFEWVTVARGYWTGQIYNEINLAPGAELGIIVGHFEGTRFIVYDNPHAPPTVYSIMEDSFRPRGHHADLNLVIAQDRENTPLTITVKIVQMPSMEVIACKNIIVTLPQLIVDMRDCDDPRGPYRAY